MVKEKLSLCTIKRHMGGDREGIAPLILNLGTRWSTAVSFTNPLSCPKGKRPNSPQNGKMGGSQDWFR